MSKKLPKKLIQVRIEKLVHGGQGLGEMENGKKVFVWNALPGELVSARIIKQKRSYAEAIAEEIIEPAAGRVEPQEANYLATSPWQIMTYQAENAAKKAIAQELLTQAHVAAPNFELVAPESEFKYRNKMEYSFWGDDDGIHLALHQRGSHGKQIVQGSMLAMPAIDEAANKIVTQLQGLEVRAGELKTIIVRAAQDGQVAASLFAKNKTLPKLVLPEGINGLRVYYSNPLSPASVPTKLLYELGDVRLSDALLGKPFTYDVDSFFQVNIPIFEKALARIKEHVNAEHLTDMYAGVGSIGLSVASKQVDLVELDPATVAMARINARDQEANVRVIEASTEKSLEYITADKPIVFDPPRAGLHSKVVDRVLETLPPKLIYLSCNPATQARDLSYLQEKYTITFFEAYNFFPRTPHIETLAVLQLT